MAFQVSPGVNVSEIDLTTVVPGVSTTIGAIAGPFLWGPADQRVLITDENQLVERFSKPANTNYETFFTAANFLAYGNQLFVVRTVMAANSAAQLAARNASTDPAAGVLVKNEDDYEENYISSAQSNNYWIGRFPGALGNSLKVSACLNANAFSETLTGTITVANGSTIVTGGSTNFTAEVQVGDTILAGTTLVGGVSSITNTTQLIVSSTYKGDSLSANTATRNWQYFNNVSRAPGTSPQGTAAGATSDQMHVVVVDEDGDWTGTKNTVLEVYEGVSKGKDATKEDGSSNFYVDVINQKSQYIRWGGGHINGTFGSLLRNTSFGGADLPNVSSLGGGADGGPKTGVATDATIVNDADLIGNGRGYNLFANPEEIDVSLILAGSSRGGTNGEGVPNYIIDNIANVRKDAIAFISPQRADVVDNTNALTDIETFRNSLTSTSYAVLDSGYKYQYDKYNDVYRYVPLNGDVAGTCVRTDNQRDAWFSPAGFNRGGIKNITKLAFSPNKAQRDFLYKRDVNPVVTFSGQGTVLFGDKTLLGQPSAFDRINVRRLFIVLEKAISTAAKFSLFEFNDEFTRAQFRNLVEPFLRDVQGRRGIFDFRVVCDETNNTGEVIDRNEFVGDIYVKPARSINFIQLNFVAVRSGVEFSEVVGQF
jgi:hypothetical protein